jgi:hypothetical protein
MKQRGNVVAYRTDARETLRMINAAIGQDFYTLRNEQVELLLAEADRVKYRKPKNANGSRGRYFYQLLQRRAQR